MDARLAHVMARTLSAFVMSSAYTFAWCVLALRLSRAYEQVTKNMQDSMLDSAAEFENLAIKVCVSNSDMLTS
jgi:uncharacterized protein (DUF1778 family)